jgi:hypothetical protein
MLDDEVEEEPIYAPDGTDLTLIRWMLAMSPAERLATLQSHLDSLWKALGDDAEKRIHVHSSHPEGPRN